MRRPPLTSSNDVDVSGSFPDDLDEFFVGQEADMTDARRRLSADIIHPDMFRQHIKRADLGV